MLLTPSHAQQFAATLQGVAPQPPLTPYERRQVRRVQEVKQALEARSLAWGYTRRVSKTYQRLQGLLLILETLQTTWTQALPAVERTNQAHYYLLSRPQLLRELPKALGLPKTSFAPADLPLGEPSTLRKLVKALFQEALHTQTLEDDPSSA